MIRKKIRSSLGLKAALITVGAIVSSVLLFFITSNLGIYFVDHYYLEDELVIQRCSEKAADFQEFVNENNVDYSDWETILHWVEEENYMYLTLYYNKEMVLSVCSWYPDLLNDEYTRNWNEDSELYREYMFTINFGDKELHAFIFDYSDDRLVFLIRIAALVISCLCIVVIVCAYSYRLTKRIVALSVCAKKMEMGDLNTHINVKGRDEIGELAGNIDNMRKDILKRMEEDQRILEENKEMLTSLSHDIRSPLSAVIGYTDLIVKNQHESEEQLMEYIKIIHSKALRLKAMTDSLFRYFYVRSYNEIMLDIQEYDAEEMLNQILGEKIIDLKAQGFIFEKVKKVENCIILADGQYLNRVFDNLFDNMKKYADRSKPVQISAFMNEDSLDIFLKNQNLSLTERKYESTNIGLKTCERIMEKMNGCITVDLAEKEFSVLVTVPARLKDSQKDE